MGTRAALYFSKMTNTEISNEVPVLKIGQPLTLVYFNVQFHLLTPLVGRKEQKRVKMKVHLYLYEIEMS